MQLAGLGVDVDGARRRRAQVAQRQRRVDRLRDHPGQAVLDELERAVVPLEHGGRAVVAAVDQEHHARRLRALGEVAHGGDEHAGFEHVDIVTGTPGRTLVGSSAVGACRHPV